VFTFVHVLSYYSIRTYVVVLLTADYSRSTYWEGRSGGGAHLTPEYIYAKVFGGLVDGLYRRLT